MVIKDQAKSAVAAKDSSTPSVVEHMILQAISNTKFSHPSFSTPCRKINV